MTINNNYTNMAKLTPTIFCYKQDYSRQEQLYESIKKTLYKFILNEEENNIKSIEKLLNGLKQDLDAYPDRGLQVMRKLGIWGLPPSDDVLMYLALYVLKNKITSIIDYGSGTGLWAAILKRYFDSIKDSKVNIIAYDKKMPMSNKDINCQRGYYDIVTNIDLKQYGNDTMLLLIWPPHNSNMAFDALTKFSGKYLVFYGDVEYTANEDFFKELKKWKLEIKFDPLSILQDSLGKYTDQIFIYKKN